jgi:hypothetical protein
MRYAVRSCFGSILKVGPGGWAFAYVAAFIIYAIAYIGLSRFEPHSFYQPAAQFEPRYQAEKTEVSKKLLDDIREMFGFTPEQRKKEGGYRIYVNGVRINDFDIDDKGAAHLSVDLPICDFDMGCDKPNFPAYSYLIGFRATGKTDPTFKLYFEIDNVSAKPYRIWSNHPDTKPDLDEEAVTAKIARVIGNRRLLFAFSSGSQTFQTFRAESELVGLIEETRGWPSPDTAEYAVRMFYLSAITITTTGYGDIVPLTSWARLLTGSEALAGTVLLGFFLYSLSAYRRTADAPDDASVR